MKHSDSNKANAHSEILLVVLQGKPYIIIIMV